MYILASSSISHQPVFRNKGFSKTIKPLADDSTTLHPDYSDFIPAMERRRMSAGQRMSLTCALDCLQQCEIEQPDAIIVGTALGCSTHTKNFLDNILNADGALISPSSFITSTHNSMAGQISLRLKNHGYNNTHTQNSLSFEHTLIDAFLCLEEGNKYVLAGAADEMEVSLYNIKAKLKTEEGVFSTGASFFLLTGERAGTGQIHCLDVESIGQVKNIPAGIQGFLKKNRTEADEITHILYTGPASKPLPFDEQLFSDSEIIHTCVYSGIYFTCSAFAYHYAVDLLSDESFAGNKILICNNLLSENLGLILLEKT